MPNHPLDSRIKQVKTEFTIFSLCLWITSARGITLPYNACMVKLGSILKGTDSMNDHAHDVAIDDMFIAADQHEERENILFWDNVRTLEASESADPIVQAFYADMAYPDTTGYNTLSDGSHYAYDADWLDYLRSGQ